MRIISIFRKVCIANLIIFFLGACSEQKAQPYEDSNDSITNTQDQGFILTH